MAKVTVNEETCIGCGACVEVCPQGVMVMGDDGKAKVQNESSCIVCRACESACPVDAIKVEE